MSPDISIITPELPILAMPQGEVKSSGGFEAALAAVSLPIEVSDAAMPLGETADEAAPPPKNDDASNDPTADSVLAALAAMAMPNAPTILPPAPPPQTDQSIDQPQEDSAAGIALPLSSAADAPPILHSELSIPATESNAESFALPTESGDALRPPSLGEVSAPQIAMFDTGEDVPTPELSDPPDDTPANEAELSDEATPQTALPLVDLAASSQEPDKNETRVDKKNDHQSPGLKLGLNKNDGEAPGLKLGQKKDGDEAPGLRLGVKMKIHQAPPAPPDPRDGDQAQPSAETGNAAAGEASAPQVSAPPRGVPALVAEVKHGGGEKANVEHEAEVKAVNETVAQEGSGATPVAAPAHRHQLDEAATPARPDDVIPHVPEPLRPIVMTVREAVANGEHEVRLQLQPESLGRVEAQLSYDGAEVRVHLTADTTQAGALLQHHAPDLRAALTEAGVAVGQLMVTVSGGRSHGHPSFERDGQDDSPRPTPVRSPALSAAASGVKTSQVDYRV